MKLLLLILMVIIVGSHTASNYHRSSSGIRKHKRPVTITRDTDISDPSSNDDYYVGNEKYDDKSFHDPRSDWVDGCQCALFRKRRYGKGKPLLTWPGYRVECSWKGLRRCQKFCRTKDTLIKFDHTRAVCMTQVSHSDRFGDCDPFGHSPRDPVTGGNHACEPQLPVTVGLTDFFFRVCGNSWEYAGHASLVNTCCFQGHRIPCNRTTRARASQHHSNFREPDFRKGW